MSFFCISFNSLRRFYSLSQTLIKISFFVLRPIKLFLNIIGTFIFVSLWHKYRRYATGAKSRPTKKFLKVPHIVIETKVCIFLKNNLRSNAIQNVRRIENGKLYINSPINQRVIIACLSK